MNELCVKYHNFGSEKKSALWSQLCKRMCLDLSTTKVVSS